MRLWHETLIPYLPKNQLLGQHREIYALRGNGWSKKHSTVDYVFQYAPCYLYDYHEKVIIEMFKRGYHPDKIWLLDPYYRGKNCNPWTYDSFYGEHTCKNVYQYHFGHHGISQYLEHNALYLQECLDNLKNKGIIINLP